MLLQLQPVPLDATKHTAFMHFGKGKLVEVHVGTMRQVHIAQHHLSDQHIGGNSQAIV